MRQKKEPYKRKTWLNPLASLHEKSDEEEALFLRKLASFTAELRANTSRIFPTNTEIFQIAKITLLELGLMEKKENG